MFFQSGRELAILYGSVFGSLLVAYLSWHYRAGLRAVLVRAGNRVIGFLRYFSVLQHLGTLFAPWHRTADRYPRGTPADLLMTLIGNLLSRILGAIARLVVVALGLAVSAIGAGAGCIGILLWLAAPLLVILFFAWGFSTLF